MTNRQSDDPPPEYSDDWRVSRVGRRAVWNGGSQPCANCRSEIDLNERHYYVELAHDVDLDGQRLRSETDRLAFCTDGCRERWFAER